MFHLQVAAWSIAVRTLIIYVALLLGLRIAGKREMGQMTPFDLVVILLVANAVQNAMVGPDTSVLGGLIAAAVLFGGNFLLATARERIPWVRGAVEGSPTLLIRNGAFVKENLSHEGIEEDEVLMAAREHGIGKIQEVQTAVLETDGSISIVPKAGNVIRTRRHVRFLKKG